MSFFRRCLTRCWRRKFPSFSFTSPIRSDYMRIFLFLGDTEMKLKLKHMLAIFYELRKRKLAKIKN